jgi:2-aminoethylphosphonate-pyruvate transaminase
MIKKLYTPGPLTTSDSVKEAMNRDLGSRDMEFIKMVADIRQRLLDLAGVSKESGYEAVILQGSGTFGIEAVLSTVIPPDGELLLIINGAYGTRMAKIAAIHGILTSQLEYPENVWPVPADIDQILYKEPDITHVAMVHCETTTGIFNDINAIGEVVKMHHKEFIVDAMSSFGAVPVDFEKAGISYLISSSNKCIEGVPGFSIVIGRRESLEQCRNQARTLSLDLYSQWKGLENDGQFRFTPPVQSLMAFHQALIELHEEGGVDRRALRYLQNYRMLLSGMRKLGFHEYLPEELQGYIITTFLKPLDPAFDFERFYQKLNQRGFVIYPGKLTKADAFRIGNIGQLYPEDMHDLVHAIAGVLDELGVGSCSGR